MRCSFMVGPANTEDWGRFNAQDWSRRPSVPDADVLAGYAALAPIADQVGFDRMWVTEHHVTPYGLTPNPLTFLAYVAGKTERIAVGTAVIVVPWWLNPLRAAEEIAMVEILLGGREFTVGLGRGIAEVEYDAMGVDRSEARERFTEGVEIIRLALTQERFSYDGQHFKIPETSMRPQPLDGQRLVDSMCGAFTSTSSLEMMAGLGMKMIFTGGKKPSEMRKDVTTFNRLRAVRGADPVKPTVLVFAVCTENESDMEAGRIAFAKNAQQIAWHYQLGDPEAFKGVKGYESYYENALKNDGTQKTAFGKLDDLTFAGPPDVLLERLVPMLESVGAEEVAIQFSFADLPFDVVERSMRLFAKDVMPTLQQLEFALPTSDSERDDTGEEAIIGAVS